MNAAQRKVVQYLDEAHATEQALVRVLQSQIAMAPPGSYRSGLESHLDETRDHAVRVGARLDALGQGSNPLMAVVGLAETVLGQALAVGKAPFDLLRGSGGEEKVLKNAKDACASESLEIATYTAIERLARSVGDDETAKLAESIRFDEEKMLERLQREIPTLTEAVVRAGANGEPSIDVIAPDAADTLGEASKSTRNAARKATAATKRTARQVRKPPRVAAAERQPKGAVASNSDQDLRAAAEAGDGAAAFTLWERLRDADVAAAEGWLRTAVELGDVRAAHRHGMLLWERREVDAAERDLGIVLREHGDVHGARYWLSRAAERDGEARQVLAELNADH